MEEKKFLNKPQKDKTCVLSMQNKKQFKKLSLLKYQVCSGVFILKNLEEMIILYDYPFRYKRFMSMRQIYSPQLKIVCLQFFDFTMVRKWHSFNRNYTWNFEF